MCEKKRPDPFSCSQSEYRIRLPQPWQTTTACVSDPNRAGVRITTHEFRRSFQRPTGLDSNSNIAIEIQLGQALERLEAVNCVLNDCDLSAVVLSSDRRRFAVSPEQLQATNNRLLIRLFWSGDEPEVMLPNVALIL